MPDFPPGGRLFANDRKTSDKAPDVTGDLEISGDLLRYLVDLADKGQPIKMRLAGWRKKLKTKSGTFYSLTASEPMLPKDSQRPVSRRQEPLDDPADEIPF